MLRISPVSSQQIQKRLDSNTASERKFDYVALLSTLFRLKVSLFAWVSVCVACAVAYIVLTPPEYVAYAQVVLETPKQQKFVVDEDGQPAPMDSAQADSRIQVIKSERLLRFVFETRGLAAKERSPESRLWPIAFQRSPLSEKARQTKALLEFMDRVGAKRIGLSYVMEISYRASSPADAADTANAIAAAYIRDRVLSGPNGSEVLQRRTTEVLQDAEVWLNGVKTGSIPADPVSIVDARVISAAIEPLSKSSPHGLLVILLAICIGMTTGIGVIFIIHGRDRKLRSERQARAIFGHHLLAVVASKKHLPDYQRACAMLADEKSARIGVVSWRSRMSTACVAQSLAETMADSERVTLLSNDSSANFEVSAFVRKLVADKEGHSTRICRATRALAENLLIEPVNFEPKAGGWIYEKELRATLLDAITQRGHTILAMPPLSNMARAIKPISETVDGLILVVEQGTNLDDIRSALDMLDTLGVGLFGAVFYAAKDHQPARRARLQTLVTQKMALVRKYRAGARLGRLAAQTGTD